MIESKISHYQKVMKTDVDGVFYCARMAAKIWQEQQKNKLEGTQTEENDCRRKSTKGVVQEVGPTWRSSTLPVSTFIVGEVTKGCIWRKALFEKDESSSTV